MELANVLLAGMITQVLDTGQVAVDDTLLVMFQGVDMHFERPVFTVPVWWQWFPRGQHEVLGRLEHWTR